MHAITSTNRLSMSISPALRASRTFLGAGQPPRCSSRASGFTLLELIIAMVIFMAIIGVILVIGTRVLASNRERSTQGVIRAVELVFEDWQTQTQAKYPEAVSFVARQDAVTAAVPNPPYRLVPIYGQRTTDTVSFIAPIIDARWADRTTANWPNAQKVSPNLTTTPVAAANKFDISGKEPGKPGDAAQPSLTLMLLAISEVVPLEQMLSGIDPKLLKRESLPAFGWEANSSPTSVTLAPVSRLIEGPVVRDAFGFPLRFVTPLAHGGYGAWTPVSRTSGVDWDTNRNQTPTVEPALPFNPTWFDPYSSIAVGGQNNNLKITRRGRPAGMSAQTNKNQVGDADEGLCRNGKPYIYSAGPDGDPRSEGDNVYSEFPDFATDRDTPRNPPN